MPETQHVPFNPSMDLVGIESSLSRICNYWAQGGWALVRIVPHTPYEHIAVFERSTVVLVTCDHCGEGYHECECRHQWVQQSDGNA